MHNRPRASRFYLAAILAVAACLRFWGLDFGLPFTQARPDETAVIDLARSFLHGRLDVAFYDYPWLYGWILAAAYLAYYAWGALTGAFTSYAAFLTSWSIDWEPFFLISRSLSAIAGTATVLVVYRIGRRLWDERTGLVAAFFLAVAFLHIRDSGYGTTDVMMTGLATLAIALLVEAHQSPTPRRFVLAGLVTGLASATKYNALLVGVPLLASYVLHVIDSPKPRRRAMADGRLGFFALGFLPAFSVGVPFVFFRWREFVRAMLDLRDSAMYFPAYGIENGWVHHLANSLRFGLGVPLLAAGLAGVALVLVKEHRKGLLVFSFPLVHYIVAGSIQMAFFRYAIPLVPFLCLAAARFVCFTNAAIVVKRPRLMYRLAMAAVILIIAAPAVISAWQFNEILTKPDNRVVVAQWFEKHVPAGSSVLQSGSPYGYAQFSARMQYHLWVWNRTRHEFVVDGRAPVGRPDWILLQQSPLPNTTQPVVTEFLRDGYVFVQQFHAWSASPGLLYDRQDAFFAPYAGFKHVSRPGPNFLLYKRVDTLTDGR